MTEDPRKSAGPRGDGSDDDNKGCGECGRVFLPWITTCPDCLTPLDNGFDQALMAQPAPRVHLADTWLDIQVSSDEPVQVALLKHFLTENQFGFEESRRFISVPASEAERLAKAIEIWAFHQDLPDDDRHVDTLGRTLRDLGHRVMGAIYSRTSMAHSARTDLLDLR